MKIRPKHELLADIQVPNYEIALHDAARSLRAQARALAGERRAAADLLSELTAAPSASRPALLEQERFRTWGVLELLVDRASAADPGEPTGAREGFQDRAQVLAELALRLADLLDSRRYRATLVHDLRARAWACIGNSRRAASDLGGAAQAFERAFAHLRLGTGDPVERAILLDRRASLERAQRRFAAARESLDKAVAIFLRNGEHHRAGRSLVNLSLVHSYAGEPAGSIAALQRALALIEPEREPRLLLSARHNLAGFLAEAGRLEEALQLYRATRPLYRKFPDAWTQNRRRWLKGKIDHGLGRFAAAGESLRAAREGFVAAGTPYEAALVSLDLALLYAEQGRTAELRRLAVEIVPVFAARGVHREALAALIVLRHTLESETVTRDSLRRLAALLRAAQHDPERRAEAGIV